MRENKVRNIINIINDEYIRNDDLWIVGYSGGKDSSAVLKLILLYLNEHNPPNLKKIIVSYCDTGIEIPVIRDFTLNSLSKIRNYANKNSLPIETKIVTPDISDSFFVKIIGRGYPPPTNKFRWCTRRLRTKPIQNQFGLPNNHQKTILLGTRNDESTERNKIITKYSEGDQYHQKQNGRSHFSIFSPVINFSEEEIWEFLLDKSITSIINFRDLYKIYSLASDENNQKHPSSRFGCWCCTVIRKDNTVRNLIKNGESELIPLYEFRNWLMEIRDLPKFRCNYRRNGVKGKGPFNLTARKLILSKLLEVENSSPFKLVTYDELLLIKELWEEDINSPIYKE